MSEYSELADKYHDSMLTKHRDILVDALRRCDTERDLAQSAASHEAKRVDELDALLVAERNAREAVEAKVARLRDTIRAEESWNGSDIACHEMGEPKPAPVHDCFCSSCRYACILAETAEPPEPASEKEV